MQYIIIIVIIVVIIIIIIIFLFFFIRWRYTSPFILPFLSVINKMYTQLTRENYMFLHFKINKIKHTYKKPLKGKYQFVIGNLT